MINSEIVIEIGYSNLINFENYKIININDIDNINLYEKIDQILFYEDETSFKNYLSFFNKYKPSIILLKNFNYNSLFISIGYYILKEFDNYIIINSLEKIKLDISPEIKNIKIDIGLSYNAPQANKWLENNPNTYIIGIEPNIENVLSILNKNIQKRNIAHSEPLLNKYINTNVIILPIAIDDVEKISKMKFYCMEKDSGCSSLLEPIDINLGPVKKTTEVSVYPLSKILELIDFNKFLYIDYIKVDAQGCDLNIIKSAGDYLKEKVVYITLEAESFAYKNSENNNIEEFDKYLNSQNFIRISHKNTSDPTYLNKKFIDIADTIYINQD
jgi:FkbM family methyltransferase